MNQKLIDKAAEHFYYLLPCYKDEKIVLKFKSMSIFTSNKKSILMCDFEARILFKHPMIISILVDFSFPLERENIFELF